jgi:hypothetical protein
MKQWFLILTGMLLGSLLQAAGLSRNATVGIVSYGPVHR